MEQLNPQQQAAVIHDAGPLIVLAGPGTGKTRVIVHRVAHAIEVRGVAPEHVLAATFTVKAAVQLRDRLTGLIGPSRAAAVRAHTLHGLCHTLLRRHADQAGLPGKPDMLDRAQELRRIHETVVADGLFAWCRAEGLASLCDELRSAFDTLSNMGVTPTDAMAFAETWHARLESDPPKDAIELAAARERLERFAETARAYARFTQRCRGDGWLTFADLILLTIETLRSRPGLRSMVRAETRCVVVDEFQDCNAAQIELLRLIAGPEGRASAPDICVVGDDDQAIYAFRHADERAFPRFERHWPSPTVINLTINYRSATSIVAAANHTISRAHSRYRPDKKIDAHSTEKGTVRVVRVEGDRPGADGIAAMILSDREAARAAKNPVPPWGSFAVICASWLDVSRVEAALALSGIPSERGKEGGAREDAGVQDLLAWIEWILDPSTHHAARRLLSRPPYGVAPSQILEWERAFETLRTRARIDDSSATGPSPASEAVPEAFDAWLATHGSEPARRLVAIYSELRASTRDLRGEEAVFRIVSTTDVAHAELLGGRERARRVSAIRWLLMLARDKQRRLARPGGLREFWDHYVALHDHNEVGLDSPIDLLGEEETAADDAGEYPEGRVRLLTAHGSKGLEFPTVLVARAHGPSGFPRSSRSEAWVAPEGLDPLAPPRSEEALDAARQDEQRRLFYVACTRAERRLIITSRIPKGKSAAVNFAVELLNWGGSTLPIPMREESHLLDDASSGPIEEAGARLRARAARRDAIERIRRGARLEAAQALERAGVKDVSQADFEAELERLRTAAETLAAVTALESKGRVPPFAARQAQGLAAIIDKAAGDEDNTASPTAIVKPMTPPLRLSYSALRAFDTCPRCFYLSRVLGIDPPESDEIRIGNIAHATLERFYRRWRDADAEGAPKPGLAELLRIGRLDFRNALAHDSRGSEDDLDQLLAQLQQTFNHLHHEHDHVLELERMVSFPYQSAHGTHTISAKIDRIDRPRGGSPGAYRIIDYKTGRAHKYQIEPSATDLQMGIYAMALRAFDPEWDGTGHAEYWLLSTGQRGVVDLAQLDLPKIRANIDKAIAKMLAGEFTKGRNCPGHCQILSGLAGDEA